MVVEVCEGVDIFASTSAWCAQCQPLGYVQALLAHSSSHRPMHTNSPHTIHTHASRSGGWVPPSPTRSKPPHTQAHTASHQPTPSWSYCQGYAGLNISLNTLLRSLHSVCSGVYGSGGGGMRCVGCVRAVVVVCGVGWGWWV
jgi:hypothetical protein